MLKLFALLHNVGLKINNHRRAFSIPHSIEKRNSLFSKGEFGFGGFSKPCEYIWDQGWRLWKRLGIWV